MAKNWLGGKIADFVGGDKVAAAFVDILNGIPAPNPAMSEAKFRDSVMKELSDLDDIELKREAGIQGSGTRIDIYAHYADRDYLITIKKGISEQKVKKVIGEMNIFLDRWKAKVPGMKTHLVFYFFGVKEEKELEALTPFLEFMKRIHRSHSREFDVTFATPADSENGN